MSFIYFRMDRILCGHIEAVDCLTCETCWGSGWLGGLMWVEGSRTHGLGASVISIQVFLGFWILELFRGLTSVYIYIYTYIYI